MHVLKNGTATAVIQRENRITGHPEWWPVWHPVAGNAQRFELPELARNTEVEAEAIAEHLAAVLETGLIDPYDSAAVLRAYLSLAEAPA